MLTNARNARGAQVRSHCIPIRSKRARKQPWNVAGEAPDAGKSRWATLTRDRRVRLNADTL